MKVYRFRSQEDPAVCAATPFAPNRCLGATLWNDTGGLEGFATGSSWDLVLFPAEFQGSGAG